ncbi:RidA family protein [Syntrophus aciditrophicus]|uniref:Translation initiation inhibitor n=1 Tax=Syntrophus aciditrophicus (strain SB) TaxID=56780 RepID=Q2LWW6_SYNAS|nr:RidA family protein [Syntrophus aciditrophicus]ABC78580.1 translation initiation inhibitor [Syntrophus aciditrophicus SB]OPY16529.1 MAG: Enamine/imine deaminase [Syntrophus sp. PtaB.Bin075]
MEKKWVHAAEAPRPVGPYAQAVKAGGWLYVSGQIPLDPQTGQLLTGSFAEQAEKTLDNLAAILKAGGSSLDSVVKVTIYLADMAYFNEFNTVYASYFENSRPARSCVAVSRLPKDALLEIEAVALCEDS